jgi:hypothetical protein
MFAIIGCNQMADSFTRYDRVKCVDRKDDGINERPNIESGLVRSVENRQVDLGLCGARFELN